MSDAPATARPRRRHLYPPPSVVTSEPPDVDISLEEVRLIYRLQWGAGGKGSPRKGLPPGGQGGQESRRGKVDAVPLYCLERSVAFG